MRESSSSGQSSQTFVLHAWRRNQVRPSPARKAEDGASSGASSKDLGAQGRQLCFNGKVIIIMRYVEQCFRSRMEAIYRE